MKRFGNPLLSLAAPLLVVVSLVGFFQREGKDRVQTIPGLSIGCGLIVSGAWERRRRRMKLLLAIKNTKVKIN